VVSAEVMKTAAATVKTRTTVMAMVAMALVTIALVALAIAHIITRKVDDSNGD
jgi:hypothetical protein